MNITANTTICGWHSSAIPITRHPIRYLDLCTYPFFLLCCTVGNIISLIVLQRDRPFGSKNIYLMGIAVADLLFMWNALFAYLSNYDGEIHGRPRARLLAFVQPLMGTAFFLQELCAVASAWLIVAFTVERFLAIKYPLKYMIISQGRRSVYIVGMIFTLASITALARLVDYYWFYANYHLASAGQPQRKINRPELLLNFNSVYLWLLIVVQLSTFFTILILNIFLIRIILQSNRLRRENLLASQSGNCNASGIDWGALAMLGSCVAIYLLTQSPTFVTNILYLLDRYCISRWDRTNRNITAPILNMLQNVNFTVNFFVYCGVNAKFRASVRHLMRCMPMPDTRRKSMDSAASTLVMKRFSIPTTRNVYQSENF